ncbi:MAG: S8 family serine peptidase [Actinomycetota bacterium]|nr:S8 family serine peptidase [Actinomycetota bacterium]
MSGIALASFLGFSAGATAEEPAPPPTPIGDAGRFQRLGVSGAAITGLHDAHDPDAIVSATVVLQGDSVSAAQTRAQQLNRSFDRASIQRQVKAQQATVLPGIQAAGATVRSSVSVVLNAVTVRVKVRDLQALAAAPGVASVHVSNAVRLFNGSSNLYTGVPGAWQDLGLTGEGMTIGVIDDGIDYYHADFGGSGDPNDWLNDDGTSADANFPTVKVAGGYDFVGDNYDANADQPGETDIPVPDDDPLACGHHGTHVSGTAAGFGVLADGSTYTGPYDANTLSANSFTVAPGAAPEATIYSYKVFGCDGSVNDDVILDSIEMAVADGVDVINMSLGSDWGTATDPLAVAIDAATDSGVLVVVSAGNAGPNAYLVGAPSTANTALSVASMDASSATLPGVAISGGITMTAQNSNLYDYATNGSVTGELVDVGLGCDLADYTPAVGKIAVTTRGVCDRVARAINGTTAGALAVVFINNAAGLPPVEGVIPGGDVPFVGVDGLDGGAFTDGLVVTLDVGADIPNPAYTNFSSFTSNGPRNDSAPKPDITAPGSNILSASVGTGTDGMLLSGTSMAAPHTAGIAVLVRQAHPTWGPLAIKGAMMATADPTRVGDFNVVRGGAGLVSALAAVKTTAYISTADGRNNLAFGFRQLTGTFVASRSITIRNTSNATITYDMSAALDDLGVNLIVSFSPSKVTVPARSSRSVSVSLKITDPENLPDADADNAGSLASINGLVYATPRSTPAGVYTLKTPLVLVPYGVSDIRAVGTNHSGNDSHTQVVKSIKLSNAGVHYGSYDTYQWAITDGANDTGDPTGIVPDIRDVGVQSFTIPGLGDLAVFAISLNDRVTTHATMEYDVYMDVDGDFVEDYAIWAVDNGLLLGGAPDGLLTAFLVDVHGAPFLVDAFTAYAPANGGVVELPVLLQDMPELSGPINFYVLGWTVLAGLAPDITADGVFDPYNPAVNNGDFDYLDPHTTTFLPTTVDLAAAADQGALGWLVVSVDDAAGAREADRVPLRARRDDRR